MTNHQVKLPIASHDRQRHAIAGRQFVIFQSRCHARINHTSFLKADSTSFRLAWAVSRKSVIKWERLGGWLRKWFLVKRQLEILTGGPESSGLDDSADNFELSAVPRSVDHDEFPWNVLFHPM
jgi:hypothetical protein